MLNYLKQHPRVFQSLFIIPIVWNIVLWTLSDPKYANHVEFALLLPSFPPRLSFFIKGLSLGVLGGTVSVIIAMFLFNVFPKWKKLRKYSVLYVICWQVAFCIISVLGFAVSAGEHLVTAKNAVETLFVGMFCFILMGIIGGFIGLFVFFLLQLILPSKS
jgi:hypothetical protein